MTKEAREKLRLLLSEKAGIVNYYASRLQEPLTDRQIAMNQQWMHKELGEIDGKIAAHLLSIGAEEEGEGAAEESLDLDRIVAAADTPDTARRVLSLCTVASVKQNHFVP